MFQFTGFNLKGGNSLNHAITLAQDLGHTYVGTEHLLASLCKDSFCTAAALLQKRHIDYQRLTMKIKESVGFGVPTVLSTGRFSKNLTSVCESALRLSKLDKTQADTMHLLIAILQQPKNNACKLLEALGTPVAALYNEAARSIHSPKQDSRETIKRLNTEADSKKNSALEKYATELTALIKTGTEEPILCREREITEIMTVLCRKNKSNPCLIGEPGVGKTAIVQGLAQKIAAGKVPPFLADKKLYSVSLNSMVAGSKYRGDFEERLQNVIQEVQSHDDIILFIDEIHNIIGSGSAEGAVDAANILKPVLARGDMKLIGATTANEYKKSIAKDGALARRFQTIVVEEPDNNSTLKILMGCKGHYESFHHVKIGEDAIHSALTLSNRFGQLKYQPDKALDLLDEACAYARIYSINRQPENEITVTPNEIMKIASQKYAVSQAQICPNTANPREQLQKSLQKRIIGQNAAIQAVLDCVIRFCAQINEEDRPGGVFLFCGPSGVGKTELAKALAQEVFGSNSALIHYDMSQFTESNSVARFIGSPPGYVGYEQGSSLAYRLSLQPRSVILLDEIEKAHPAVFSFLLQLLEEGKMKDAAEQEINCRNAIIILTSNLGADYYKQINAGTGFVSVPFNKNGYQSYVFKQSEKFFSPEFLNRIDSIAIFQTLTLEDLTQIAENQLNLLQNRIKNKGILLSRDKDLPLAIAKRCYNTTGQARSIKAYIKSHIENDLAAFILNHADDTPVEYEIKLTC